MIQDRLDDRSLAALNIRFIVPLAVSSILAGEEELDDIAEYTIQEIFSELPADAALLGMALCAQHIGSHIDNALGRVLLLEADKIVHEYGPLWLAFEAGEISSADIARMKSPVHVPEDLESLSDLMFAVCDSLSDERQAVAAILCDIIAEQASLHRDYAEAQLEFDWEDDASLGHAASLSSADKVPMSDPAPYQELAMAGGSNVIPFPRRV